MSGYRVAAVILTLMATGAASVGARPISPPRPRALVAGIPAPSAGDVSYGLAQVRVIGRSSVLLGRTSAGQVAYAGRVGGLAVTVRSPVWSALRASTRVYLVVSRVAGRDGSVRDLALFVVRKRTRNASRRRFPGAAGFVLSVANATPVTGSFWARGLDRGGFAQIFAVRDMLATAIANWRRYLRVLRAADALAAAIHPLEPPRRARSVGEGAARRTGGLWTGGDRPTPREAAIFHLLVDALGNPLEYAAVKRNPLIAQFIARDLGNSLLAQRWRRITTHLPLQVPDKYAAAAQEEARFTHVVSPRVSHHTVAISDSANSSSQLGSNDPLSKTTLTVDPKGYGGGLVAGREEVYGPNIDGCTTLERGSDSCTATFSSGATYETLTASPRPVAAGLPFAGDPSIFVGWNGCDQVLPSGDCKVLVGAANRTVTANFTLANSIQVILAGSATHPALNGLYVSSDPPGITCDDDPDRCIAVFAPGQEVTLTENHGRNPFDSAGIEFHGWGGCDRIQPAIGSTDTCKVTVAGGGRQVVADFEVANAPPPPTPDERPAAAFSITPNPALPTSQVTLDGSASSDPDGQISDYRWSLSTGVFFDSFSDPQFMRPLGCFGSVVVTLTVTDSDGQTATASRDLAISPQPGFGHCEVGGQPSIITIAGSGAPCHLPACGDDGPATSAQLDFPGGVAVDGQGNTYIADTVDQEVREITPEGTITRFAGTGTVCFTAGCGDNAPALNAQLDNPQAVAVDAAGNVYIADTDDQTVRKVAGDGTITRVAGRHGDICTTAPECGDGGPATSARLDQPSGVAIDGNGDLYIADAGDNEIRVVTPDGTIHRFAGTGTQCTSAPDCRDNGPAANATLSDPTGIAVDRNVGIVYIADTGDNEVRFVTPFDGQIRRLAGTGRQCRSVSGCGDAGPAINATLNMPADVAVDPRSGEVYISDTGANLVRLIDDAGTISSFAGNQTPCTTAPDCGDGEAATGARLRFPQGVAVDNNGRVDIADTQDNEIRQVAP